MLGFPAWHKKRYIYLLHVSYSMKIVLAEQGIRTELWVYGKPKKASSDLHR